MLELTNVYAGYNGSDVLEGVSMNIERGDVVALLGRNGVGKSTTLRTIIGLLDVNEGSITYEGRNLTGWEPHETYGAGVALVPEDRGIFPDLTVEENLRVPVMKTTNRTRTSSDRARPSDENSEWTIEELYEFFPKLEELTGSKGKHLSGGEQQMLAIARALRSDPDLVLLDEPSEGLAPQIVERVGEVIEEIAEGGTSLLIVEQNVEFTLDVANKTYIMDHGQIVFNGTPEDVRNEEENVEQYLGIHEK